MVQQALPMDGYTRESRFDSLYSAHSGEVLKYALRQGVDRADAEDVVVETFLVCWRRLDEAPEPTLPWLLGVARRVVANHRRGAKRRLALHTRIVQTLLHPARPVEGGYSDPPALEAALASLSDGDREAISLVIWHGLTHEAAAQVIGCSRNTLTKRYLRACRKLRAQLPPSWTLSEYEEKEGSPGASVVSE